MVTALYTHPDMLDHQPSVNHPDRPERLQAVLGALKAAGDLRLEPRAAPFVTRAELDRVHDPAFVEALFAQAPTEGRLRIDADTLMSPGSLTAARRAAGAVVDAVRSVARGEIERAFCAVRPPGHHAGPDTAMGFCLFSNIAVAARAAQHEGLARVAIVDFDVHHGNGTQTVVESDPNLFFASIHQAPNWPGTGDPSETGLGNVVNRTVAPYAARERWRAVFEDLMAPLDAFAPDLILISAGFDAHARDPLAEQGLEAEDYAWATRAIAAVARTRSRGRIVSSLEGGYDLEALGQSALAHVRALAEG
jgi:acetoin utilization deacetylase AcuC-like enzyme